MSMWDLVMLARERSRCRPPSNNWSRMDTVMSSAGQSWRRDAWVSNRVVFESISPLLELSQKARNRGNTSSLTHRFYVETSPGRRGADERTYRREHEVALSRPCLAPYSVLAA